MLSPHSSPSLISRCPHARRSVAPPVEAAGRYRNHLPKLVLGEKGPAAGAPDNKIAANSAMWLWPLLVASEGASSVVGGAREAGATYQPDLGVDGCAGGHRLDELILDFTLRENCDSWTTIDDRVMGGGSRSSLQYMSGGSSANVSYKPSCRFEGNLETTDGGFASARWVPQVKALTDSFRYVTVPFFPDLAESEDRDSVFLRATGLAVAPRALGWCERVAA